MKTHGLITKKDDTYKYFVLRDDWTDNFAMHLRNNRVEEREKQFLKVFKPAIMGLVMMNPLIGVPNDFKAFTMGEDIYGNKQDLLDGLLSGASLATFGFANLKVIKNGLTKMMLIHVSNNFNAYSVINTTSAELKNTTCYLKISLSISFTFYGKLIICLQILSEYW